MKSLKITKGQRVENKDAELLGMGMVAFQLVNFELDYFGNKMEFTLDTKIMKDGRQLVIDGNGFIPAGYEVK